MDATTLCPECGARQWLLRNQDQRCVCGNVFRAETSEPFVTAAEKAKAQGAGRPTRGPQPVDKPAPAKRTRKTK